MIWGRGQLISWLAALAVVLCVGAVPSLRANELENGDFEDPEILGGELADAGEPWVNFGEPDTRFTTSAFAFSGFQSLKTFGPFDALFNGTGASQDVAATPNSLYSGTIYAQQVTGDELQGDNFGVYKLEFRDANMQLVGTDEADPGTPLLGYNVFESEVFDGTMPADEWVELTVQGLSPPGTEFARALFVQIQMGDGIGNFTGGAIYWDDASLVGSQRGDFNGNGSLDTGDIDDLTTRSASGTNPLPYDLNDDQLVNVDDVVVWVHELFGTWIGDADLNGLFNSDDLIQVAAAVTYDQDVDAVWTTGDFNGSGRFDSDDLINAAADLGYDAGPFPGAGVAAVPEPAAGLLVILGLMGLAPRRRRSAD